MNSENNNKPLWTCSKYNFVSNKGDKLLIYNSLSGIVGEISEKSKVERANHLLKNGTNKIENDIDKQLVEVGILVNSEVSEQRESIKAKSTLFSDDYLTLIIMPTEACNFRCVYCYEDYENGKMYPSVIEGIKNFIKKRLPYLKELNISWFGGEPLLEPNVIKEITDSFLEDIQAYSIKYSSNMTTNGYLLNPKICRELVDRGINRFAITLDGISEDHDSSRLLRDGQGTFQRIVSNLKKLKATDIPFRIDLRCNYTSSTNFEKYIQFLKEEFSEDARFQAFFRAVGKWGGGNDQNLKVCTGDEAWNLGQAASLSLLDNGINIFGVNSYIQPLGAVCYAAMPNSVVIGSDGTLYKCTVALKDDFNKVGIITSNGELEINQSNFSKWIISEDYDSKCEECYFQASCQGGSCPLTKIRDGENKCPMEKEKMADVLKILRKSKKIKTS